MANETIQTLTTLAGLSAIVWRASKLQYDLQKSIESASEKSDEAVKSASFINEEAIKRASDSTKEGQRKLQERFEKQFDKLQEQNADRYRELNQSLQLHLRDFDHEILDRKKTDELILSNLEALKAEFNKELLERDKIIEVLQKQNKDLIGFLEKNHGFINRDR